jgi:HEAT repeat protein
MLAALSAFFKSTGDIEIWNTALELEQITDRRAVKHISRAMIFVLRDRDVRRRRAAARVLGWLRWPPPRAVDALIRTLHDSDPGVREEAAESLAYLHARRSIAPLIAALRDPAPNVRFFAAFALGSLKIPRGRRDTRIKPALESLLADDATPEGNWWPVRLEALMALYDDRFTRERARVQADPNASVEERRWADRYSDF